MNRRELGEDMWVEQEHGERWALRSVTRRVYLGKFDRRVFSRDVDPRWFFQPALGTEWHAESLRVVLEFLVKLNRGTPDA